MHRFQILIFKINLGKDDLYLAVAFGGSGLVPHFSFLISHFGFLGKTLYTPPYCAVKSLPVRCRFRFSLPDRESLPPSLLCDYKGLLPPSPKTLTAFYSLLYFVTALYPPP
jgi:hypothetical protein